MRLERPRGSISHDQAEVWRMDDVSAAKRVVGELFDAISEGHPERWLDLVAPTFVLNGNETSAEQWVEFGRALKRDDPARVIHVEEMIQEGDRVVARLRSTGRQTSRWLGYEPTDRSYTTKGVYVFTVTGDRITEAWDVWDSLGQLVQLGHWPPAGHKI
jgi:ketosteroid isomerase-like protein